MKRFKATFDFAGEILVLAKVVSVGNILVVPADEGGNSYCIDIFLEGISGRRYSAVIKESLSGQRLELLEALEEYYRCVLHSPVGVKDLQ
jgi:hypothetical protein